MSKPNPKYKPLTESQFKSQFKTYLKGNPDVAAEFGSTFEDAWKHYQEKGIADIQSGTRLFNKTTPTLIRQYGLQYPKEFGLIDKNNKHTSVYTKYFPDQARQYILNNYSSIYDKKSKNFSSDDLKFLRDNKFSNEEIVNLAKSYGVSAIDPNLLKYDAKKKTYATPELSPIAADIFVNYGNYDVGEKGIFDQADVSLLRSLGYNDADIISRAKNLFGDDKLSPEVIQQYFPNLVFRKPPEGPPPALERPTPPTITAPTITAPTITAPTVEPPTPTVEPTLTPTPTVETIPTPTTTPEPIFTPAPTPVPITEPTVDFPSWFKGVPGGSRVPSDVSGVSSIPLPTVVNPMINYFANAPISRAIPTLPHRFKTLSPENVDIRRGLNALQTSRSLLAPASLVQTRPTFSPQYVSPSTAQEIQALAAEANVPAGVRAGGRINLAEGGMPKLTPTEAGSRFDVSQYVDPQTGRFYINEFQRDIVFNPELREAERVARERMTPEEEARAIRNMQMRMGFAQGGMPNLSRNVAAQGRYGDSMLVHMSPEEVQGLRGLARMQGMDMTINPRTGLPEAFSLKKLFKAVVPMLPFLPIPGIQGLSLLAKSALSGIIGGFTSGKGGFNFKEGLKTGIMAFAGGKLMEGMAAAGQAGQQAAGTTATEAARLRPSLLDAAGATQPVVDASITGASLPTVTTGAPSVAPTYYDPSTQLSLAQANLPPNPNVVVEPMRFASTAPTSTAGPTMSVQGTRDVMSGAKNLLSGSPEASSTFTAAAGVQPKTALMLGGLGYTLNEADKEKAAIEAQNAAIRAEEERRRRRGENLFARTLGPVPMGAGGGMVALARGGMPTFEYGGTTAPTGEPRMVKGAGDGMSDNVPANIEGVQEARLANDEFVVPADVVADIGNGSSSAGAKKLYAMMDRVRKARHGTTEQPPEIDAERLMPA